MDPRIAHLETQFVEAFNAGNVPAAVSAFYATDAILVLPHRPPAESLPDIQTSLQELVTNGVQTLTLKHDQSTSTGNLAYVTGRYTFGSNQYGSPPELDVGISTILYRFQAGVGWQAIVHVCRSDRREHLLDEWKECRTSIERFDKLIVDIRKYGFTLITGLLTAGAFWFVKPDDNQQADYARSGISFVLNVLILALFIIDRANEVFLRAAVKRAERIEKYLGSIGLTTAISDAAEKTGIVTWAVVLYTLFLLVDPSLPLLKPLFAVVADALTWLTTLQFLDQVRAWWQFSPSYLALFSEAGRWLVKCFSRVGYWIVALPPAGIMTLVSLVLMWSYHFYTKKKLL